MGWYPLHVGRGVIDGVGCPRVCQPVVCHVTPRPCCLSNPHATHLSDCRQHVVLIGRRISIVIHKILMHDVQRFGAWGFGGGGGYLDVLGLDDRQWYQMPSNNAQLCIDNTIIFVIGAIIMDSCFQYFIITYSITNSISFLNGGALWKEGW